MSLPNLTGSHLTGSLFDLTGQTALITGASSGLGGRAAQCLSHAGARVILAARRLEVCQKAAKQLGNATAVAMDVTDAASVQAAWNALDNQGERISICINNAGIGGHSPLLDPSCNTTVSAIFQTNVLGVWHGTQAAALHMKKHALPGSIINISSINGANKVRIERTAYAASKAAVIQLSKALVGELSPFKIRINCILPGLFTTPLTEAILDTPEKQAHLLQKIPLDFVATPSDLDGALLFLASNKASRYVTGASLTVDGGASWGGW